jgi:hypothetical protein
VGKRFWDALLQLLTMIERHLSLWAAGRLGEPVDRLGAALLPYYAPSPDSPPAAWSRRWTGRYDEFYREAARLVEPLTWAQVRDVGGAELAVLAAQLRTAYGAVKDTEIPARLRLGVVPTADLDDGRVATGYNSNDMLRLSTALVEALEGFDGRRPTDEVRERIASQVDGHFDHAAVRRLVDFGILLPTTRVEAHRQC